MIAQKKWWVVLLAPLLFVAFGLDAYGGLFTVSGSWDEEVQLHDGRIITIERSMTRERFGEIGQYGPVTSQKIIFRGEHGRIVWEDDIGPVIFDIVDNVYYVVADPRTPYQCEKHGNPNPPFIFYKYDNKKWIQISHTEFPDGLQTNLFLGFWDDRPASGGKVLASEKPTVNGNLDNKWMKFLGHFNKDLNQRCALL